MGRRCTPRQPSLKSNSTPFLSRGSQTRQEEMLYTDTEYSAHTRIFVCATEPRPWSALAGKRQKHTYTWLPLAHIRLEEPRPPQAIPLLRHQHGSSGLDLTSLRGAQSLATYFLEPNMFSGAAWCVTLGHFLGARHSEAQWRYNATAYVLGFHDSSLQLDHGRLSITPVVLPLRRYTAILESLVEHYMTWEHLVMLKHIVLQPSFVMLQQLPVLCEASIRNQVLGILHVTGNTAFDGAPLGGLEDRVRLVGQTRHSGSTVLLPPRPHPPASMEKRCRKSLSIPVLKPDH